VNSSQKLLKNGIIHGWISLFRSTMSELDLVLKIYHANKYYVDHGSMTATWLKKIYGNKTCTYLLTRTPTFGAPCKI
jgi:hypothetical protein